MDPMGFKFEDMRGFDRLLIQGAVQNDGKVLESSLVVFHAPPPMGFPGSLCPGN